ncbi:hypothetical protein [Lentzea sp. NBRC 102530]|uniref:hypothetical protein n=1 Tax=Lentzea sp. NBRC 102530 TaxID=3032201 RepID=UPI0024A1ADF4|nr:hypothetical protein [Lentzea sp. NBRC 102530]GLY49597.1 hypothetical protein Lesp01_32530 [Lentzea sp. NBRC 102530]
MSLGRWLVHEPLGRNCWYFPLGPVIALVVIWLVIDWPHGALVLGFVVTGVVDVIARYLWWRSDRRKAQETGPASV